MIRKVGKRWPSGVPVFRDRTGYQWVGVDFDPAGYRGVMGVYYEQHESLFGFEDMIPLNADARTMLAIAKAGR